ncbi:hypothetical protein DEU56DRAFT_758469 [Suillus clintonianus]|uniref:uncharacterized protein n=1 Tax=Suillus clintonianus TaxID=1904413 RepID=UPI001B864FEA|nr:uncharacterized protein DEU56DRAFT_758469 [Suillus clintonianus]KAG2128280.1 hypothetical protein DEU56DRAFT_758469 [Suillus clintonianus]
MTSPVLLDPSNASDEGSSCPDESLFALYYSTQASRAAATRNFIGALPIELLLAIFTHLYQSSRRLTQTGEKWGLDDPLSSLFPYAPAAVCSVWCSVLSRVPEFWTRVVIRVDSQYTRSRDVRRYFEWSRDLHLDVIITRHRDEFEGDDKQERSKVRNATRELVRHIARCRSIRFNVMYSSSLPSLLHDFHQKDAPHLHTLKLNCKVDDGGSPPQKLVHWRFDAPGLRNLYLDARNFFDVCVDRNNWLRRLHGLSSLSVSRYRHLSNKGIDLYKLLRAVEESPGIAYLELKDLHFSRVRPWTTVNDISIELISMNLEDLAGEVLSEIIGYVDSASDATRITRCPITTCHHSLISGGVAFHDLSADQDLMVPLAHWRGRTLSLVNSACFHDNFLRDMLDGGPHDQSFACKGVKELYLINCTNFSPRLLKTMVSTRRKIARRSLFWRHDHNTLDWTFPTVAPITLISVEGGPALSKDDRKWFERNLGSFHWDEQVSFEDPDDSDPDDGRQMIV